MFDFACLLWVCRIASVHRSRPTGGLFFCVAKKTGQKGEPAHGRAKIPRLFLEHPLKARSALFFSTNSTKRLPIVMVTMKNLFD
jgi:hypothetical protein